MKIQVKQEHIEEGQRCDGNNCPIALAVKAQVPGVDKSSVSVDDDGITFEIGYTEYNFRNVEGVAEFIGCFDTHGEPEPREFDLVDLANGLPDDESCEPWEL